MAPSPFLTVESLQILRSITKNNNREWYQKNKSRVDEFLIDPARGFVVEVGKLLDKAVGGLVADPRVDGSIYRLYRDVRFSSDKRPLKEHLGLIWWMDAPEGKLSSPCFYLHVTPDGWLWSVGCYRFTPPMLDAYRRAVLDPAVGPPLKFIARGLENRGLVFNPPELKRVPRGFEGPEWTGEWVRRKGAYTFSESQPLTDQNLLGPKAAKFIAGKFREGTPFYIWLRNIFDKLHPPDEDGRAGRDGGAGESGLGAGGGRRRRPTRGAAG
ncbi:MAG: DUF2461 domain-containing protein [Deltaproteobacteria bacterium]|jgi:uncharacterized protein (TIGR02453 family)|nr:DUF2461 domain-containing protein [Deltaproteobacteria bacterium]